MTRDLASRGAPLALVTTSRRQTLLAGMLAGVTATVLFMALHAVLILGIWDMLVPMSLSGALCGASIAWSYRSTVERPSVSNWITMNGAYVATLMALGVVSILWFKPKWTFAELNVEGAPLGELFSRAAPLMVAFAFVGALSVWAIFSRRNSSLGPIVVAETLLVLLIGHNVAIIGLVDFSDGGWYFVAEMFGFVILLGALYSIAFIALVVVRNRII